jgi:ubiquinone/menaquinone biosynthesis C-methylase UbiE
LKPITFNKYDEMGAYHWVQCDRAAPNYNPPLEARYRVLVKRVKRAKKILDVGCGDGYLLAQVSELCDHAVGIDSARLGVSLANEKLKTYQNCSVAQASCYEIPLPDKSFDCILLADVFEHLEQPARCIAEITRLLETNGRLLLTTPKWRPDRMWDSLHVKEYKPEELLNCLEQHFAKIELSYFWPMSWYNKYATRFGSKAIRLMARYLPNPYVQESQLPEDFGQILAECSQPIRQATQ